MAIMENVCDSPLDTMKSQSMEEKGEPGVDPASAKLMVWSAQAQLENIIMDRTELPTGSSRKLAPD